LKLVSDFDGIWTNQAIEAEYVRDFIIKSLCETGDLDVTQADRLLTNCKSEINKEPHNYGWFNNGMIAAHYHEDPYGDNNAIFDYIDKYADLNPELVKLKEAILKKYASLADFSQYCFIESTTKFKNEGKLVAVETTGKIVKDLNSMNVNIIVVSNSKTEKIKYLFTNAGVEITDENSPQRKRVHARGDAQKYVMDKLYTELPEFIEVSEKISIPLRRSRYHKILMEEKPDFVIGDVFSLDIALPLYLRMNDESFRNLKVIQRVQPYTPDWVTDFLKRDEFENIAYTVNSVEELPGLILNLNQ